MSTLADRRRQGRQLVRLRAVRMEAAARSLTAAREATAAAERARRDADHAVTQAETRQEAAHRQLADDPQEAERLLAVVDQARFRRALAETALGEARAAEQACETEEAARRKAMIVARARHDVIEAEADRLSRHVARQVEERAALDAEDVRRFR